ncbi:MAG: toxin-activating lysine-acyltransferase [Pseudomonadota bacterium]
MTGLTDSTGKALPPEESPSEKALHAMGDALFLATRSPRHREMSVGMLRAALEPPILLEQYKVFRFDDVPRGMITWARLSPEAERRYVQGEPFQPDDWASGDRLWLIDLIAPYAGLTPGIVRWVMVRGNFTDREFLFRRVVGDRQTRKIVHIDFDRPAGKAKILAPESFR